MDSHLPQPVEVLAQLEVELVHCVVKVQAGLIILPPVQHPRWDVIELGVLHNLHDLLDLLGGQLSCQPRVCDACSLDHRVSEPTADPLDHRQGVQHVSGAVNVGVEDANDVVEFMPLLDKRRILFLHLPASSSHSQAPVDEASGGKAGGAGGGQRMREDGGEEEEEEGDEPRELRDRLEGEGLEAAGKGGGHGDACLSRETTGA
mmetsp:Transcript_614/g.1615  ORF Transcript_614/g.1615 Transcript_614/m.1615 type:complete len:204 (+) Transcript_614:961-1572(+)